ncbi:cytochrome P450 monooxygenase Bot3 [Aspergillus chevalieri]|uniref:Cytochrome P450 monooxygenase Bot3 n=1 Tax=Aspergillus chevalieri TaxID=182096 RepID=A0A7R7VHU0_ASPCH|nr:cytochrome P450 monooxygenase Bot3 [Aspergillus chevalieri]BCR84622.1 cytochrome P450 monooxygenase Bot3 [Aspergillus chevalieri]
MDQYLLPFTEESQSCLGINLAWAELYLATAMVFRPGGPKLSLYDMNESDIEFARDFLTGFPKHDSRGIRVMVN